MSSNIILILCLGRDLFYFPLALRLCLVCACVCVCICECAWNVCLCLCFCLFVFECVCIYVVVYVPMFVFVEIFIKKMWKKTFWLVVQTVLHKKVGWRILVNEFLLRLSPREAQAIPRPVKLVFIGSALQARGCIEWGQKSFNLYGRKSEKKCRFGTRALTTKRVQCKCKTTAIIK